MDFHLKKGSWIFIFCIVSSIIFISLLIHQSDSVAFKKVKTLIEESIEVMTLDHRFRIRNLISEPAHSGNVVIVAIDERSLKEFGRWPWSRILQARLIREIIALHPKILAVDLFYPESESKEADESLGNALRTAKENVVLAATFDVPIGLVDKEDNDNKEIPDQIIDSAFLRLKEGKHINPVIAEQVLPTIPAISQGSLIGHVYSHPDYDGKLRWEILYLKYSDEFFPSLALQTARLSLGVPLDEMVLIGDKGVQLGEKVFIPSYGRGRMLINYIGKEGSFRTISAADILTKKVRREEIENRIVFLGTTAIATYDIKNTPFSVNMPGVEKNATIVENILTKNFLEKSVGYVEIIAIILTGLIMGFVLPKLNAMKTALLSSVFLIGYTLAVVLFFSYMGLWVNFIYPTANIIIISVVITGAKYFFEEKKAKEIRSMFSSYVSPKIVEVLINNPDKANLGGERKVVTVLFADLMGFTSLSEKKLPEEVVEFLNEYFKEMTDIIFKWDGTLDKFVGDEIMAFWGAPVDQPDHAERAVRCALDMIDSLTRMQEKWIKEGKDFLNCGIGINTGEVLIGNIGAAGKKMDYTIIGDNVNLAARVEKLTRNYGVKIILTEFTRNYMESMITRELIGHYELRALEAVKVKGKEKEVEIFALKGIPHEKSQPE
jgi:adenylate cyclase